MVKFAKFEPLNGIDFVTTASVITAEIPTVVTDTKYFGD